ncbi:MAG: hypothetical protein D8M59_12310 [Planctomycetes bacterium]|nr:hypothetical protein [Planctomycetota bacterium]NOG53592.1 hypothetical protein [Planctomycetota bacterium]
MTVVRNRQADTLLKDAIVLDLGDLKKQGDQLILRARQSADRTMNLANEQARKIIDAADKTGYDAGFERGKQEGHEIGREAGRTESLEHVSQQLAQLHESWQAALTDLEQTRRSIIIDAKQELLSLALQITRRVVHRTVQTDATIIADQLEQALKVITYRSQLIITVNPADHDLAKAALPDLFAQLNPDSRDEAARIETDERVTRGGCLVHHEKIDVDATIDTLLDRIEASLLPANAQEDAGTQTDDRPPEPEAPEPEERP